MRLADLLCWALLLRPVSLIVGLMLAQGATGQPLPQRQYELESIEILGSNRMTEEQLREQLGIKPRTLMTDAWLSEARTNLLGLGIFRDALFSLRKGSKPGFAKLVVKVDEDEDVLSDWAMGGEFGLALTEPTPAFGEDSVFRGYRVGLIARNILRASHRASLLADVNSRGSIVFGQMAYGLPRFVAEEIQFDTALMVVDPYERYFETEGYGLKIQSLWTRQRRGFDITYGVAWYSNNHSRFQLETWPDLVAGPKLGIQRETRFLGFIPGDGYRASAAVIPSMLHRDETVMETELSGTISAKGYLALTVSGKSVITGRTAISNRGQAKIEIPITSANRGLRSQFYIAAMAGNDHFKEESIRAREYVSGFRYHSTGFIGDINFRVVGLHPWRKISIETSP
jgi:hypothetical protein